MERLFASHIGLPPVRHYLRIRVDHAKRLIEGTRMPLIDIAIACGFMSASHFAKCSRSFNGISPHLAFVLRIEMQNDDKRATTVCRHRVEEAPKCLDAAG